MSDPDPDKEAIERAVRAAYGLAIEDAGKVCDSYAQRIEERTLRYIDAAEIIRHLAVTIRKLGAATKHDSGSE